ncbi:AsmA family protein [Candidatus Deferrimicrobium sp.]|uniref:AsmA family protein n=1 Tax=Candidatus Deferrimicrobium sp. TaxID=3060586 RepID=UPI0027172D57|nr:AsmA family protein [Candidatus Deferrimicrobium sp.]MDO8739863.1 AsmA family protein [Candidatus Deferrimicrobium sp.]
MKKLFAALGILVALLVLAGVAILVLVDVGGQKPRIESAVSEALGMEFRILGKARLRFFPSASIVLSDVRLRNRGTDLATAQTLRMGVKLRPLLDRQLVITELALEKPVIRIEKGIDGKFNYETPPRPAMKEGEAPSAPLAVSTGSVSAGKIVYVDRKTKGETSFDAIDLSVRDLLIPTTPGVKLSKRISFSGDLSVKEMKTKGVAVSDVRAKVTAGAGVCEIRPFTMKLFGGTGEGRIRVDLSGEEPALKVKYTLAKFRVESALAEKKYLSGPMTVTPDLSFRGKSVDEMMRTISGTVSLRGDGLTFHGMEIDEILSKAEKAQKFNLADVGAFMLAGPLGSAVLKGYRYEGLFQSVTREGETRITRLVSDWTVRDGVADARDVAFSTGKNRIALKGKLDLVNKRFVDVTVAMLDEKGCAKVRQKISGPFDDPRMDKPSMLRSFVEPILKFVERARKLIGRSSCEPFYTGTVQHP